MMFSSSVVLFLVIAGPILSFETEADRQSYAAFLSWTFCDWAKTLPCHRMGIHEKDPTNCKMYNENIQGLQETTVPGHR